MTNLNQVSESFTQEQSVCDDLISQIKSHQMQINMTRTYLAHIDWYDTNLVITISKSPFERPIPMMFGNSVHGLDLAFNYIKKHTHASPIGSSSPKDGNVLEVSA